MSDTAAVQVTQHSPRVVGSGRSSRLAAFIGAVLLLLATLPRFAAAEPAPLDARVVWVRGPYAYVAASDSLAISPFSRLTFTMKSKPVATAEVERSVDGGMVVVRITSGSLAAVKHLDRLRILAERPDRPRLLRVGYPSATRANLNFARDSMAFATLRGYVLEGEAPSLRLIRNPDDLFVERWPDTLLIRTFDDATDQEIALERGELDVAMFWPGELSSRMREHPRWKDRLSWPFDRGLAEPRTVAQHDVVSAPAQGQMVCRPELLPYLKELGPGPLASLLQCIPSERRP